MNSLTSGPVASAAQASASASASAPSLRDSLAACQRDAAPFLNRFQSWRMRVCLALHRLSSLHVQRRLEAQSATLRQASRNEAIARMYLGCRDSLPLANHFPVLLAPPAQRTSGCAERAAALAGALMRLSKTDPSWAARLSSSRQAQPHCDTLRAAPFTTHFVVLRRGVVFEGACSDVADPGACLQFMRQVLNHEPATASEAPSGQVRVGEFTALPRDTWHRERSRLAANPLAVDTLRVLDEAAFLICLDDETRPSGVQALARCLRLDNWSNRHWDKCIQVVVLANGETGLLCDHAALDGMDAVGLAQALSRETASSHAAAAAPGSVASRTFDCWLASTQARSRAWRGKRLRREERVVMAAEWAEYDAAFFQTKSVPMDSLMQLAIQLAFQRSTGRMPSVFEPVSLAHWPAGRLDFISPVSAASVALVQGLVSGVPRELSAQHLSAAVAKHRGEVRHAKQGQGHLGHLLALLALEFAHHRARGVRVHKAKEWLLSTLDRGMALLARRDVMASNAGRHPAVRLFGTITHRNHMLAVGYALGTHALVVDIQAQGCHAAIADSFKKALFHALSDLGRLAGETP
jgi:carnitine O-acetyltransferase